MGSIDQELLVPPSKSRGPKDSTECNIWVSGLCWRC